MVVIDGGGIGGRFGAGSGVANTGGGGGGNGMETGTTAGSGGSGVAIFRYPSYWSVTIGAGLSGSTETVGSNKVTTITQGTGNISWGL
jgi:hypothetical protein